MCFPLGRANFNLGGSGPAFSQENGQKAAKLGKFTGVGVGGIFMDTYGPIVGGV